MYNWFFDLVTAGLSFNLWLQNFHHPVLIALFTLITYLGDQPFYLAVIPFIYWSLHKKFGRRLAYLLIVGYLVNGWLKNLFRLPRPPVELHLVHAEGYGFPSGHAMTPTVVWGYTAWVWRHLHRWVLPGFVIFIGLITFSRLYLSVHYPADSLGGLFFGLIMVLIALPLVPRIETWASTANPRLLIVGSVIFSLIVLFAVPGDSIGYPSEVAATAGGFILGMNLGFLAESRWVRFKIRLDWRSRWLSYGLGLMFVLIFWLGLRILFGLPAVGYATETALRFVRYTVTGLALSWWAPWAFIKLNLADQEAATSE